MTPRPRGVSNRNAALDWIIRHVKTGVFYFADDDNSYDVRLFEEVTKQHTVLNNCIIWYCLIANAFSSLDETHENSINVARRANRLLWS